MKRKVLLVLAMLMVLSIVPSFASDTQVVFEDTILLTEKGGTFEIGFVTVKFPKDATENLPMEIEVDVYAEEGIAYIEFTDVDAFFKSVKISTKGYDGLLYDVATGENVEIDLKNQNFKVDHFSRWCFD